MMRGVRFLRVARRLYFCAVVWMKGLRIRTRFYELMAVISHRVSGYYWVLEDVTFVHHGASGRLFDERRYRESVLQQSQSLVLLDSESLTGLAEFILGDWDSIYGLRERVELAAFSGYSSGVAPETVEVYLSCTDAAFWEVFARSEDLLLVLKRAFPEAEECLLSDRQY